MDFKDLRDTPESVPVDMVHLRIAAHWINVARDHKGQSKLGVIALIKQSRTIPGTGSVRAFWTLGNDDIRDDERLHVSTKILDDIRLEFRAASFVILKTAARDGIDACVAARPRAMEARAAYRAEKMDISLGGH